MIRCIRHTRRGGFIDGIVMGLERMLGLLNHQTYFVTRVVIGLHVHK